MLMRPIIVKGISARGCRGEDRLWPRGTASSWPRPLHQAGERSNHLRLQGLGNWIMSCTKYTHVLNLWLRWRPDPNASVDTYFFFKNLQRWVLTVWEVHLHVKSVPSALSVAWLSAHIHSFFATWSANCPSGSIPAARKGRPIWFWSLLTCANKREPAASGRPRRQSLKGKASSILCKIAYLPVAD